MMISHNQSEAPMNTNFGVFAIMAFALMIVDAFFGGIVREYFSLRMMEYGLIMFAAIAAARDLVKESGPGGRLLRSYSQHGL